MVGRIQLGNVYFASWFREGKNAFLFELKLQLSEPLFNHPKGENIMLNFLKTIAAGLFVGLILGAVFMPFVTAAYNMLPK